MAKRPTKKKVTKKAVKKKPIESYNHTDKKRANNPPVGLVIPYGASPRTIALSPVCSNENGG